MSEPAGPRIPLVAGLFLAAGIAAIVEYRGEPRDLLLAGGLIALFTPLKALMVRWLGGVRPYSSAFVASAFSMLVGLAFREPLNLWTLLVRSAAVTAGLEFVALYAMRTHDRIPRLATLAVYMSIVVHLLSGGFVLMNRAPGIGFALMAAGALVMWSPLLVKGLFGRPLS